jgi:prepilin-type N-terminal cleavage/methylation domain-containing protein
MRFSADDGFSLAEMMMVTMLVGIILSAAYLAMNLVNKVSDGLIARSAAQDQGQLALETMTREIRQGQEISDPSTGDLYKTAAMTATKYSFYSDIDHDGYVERVTYTDANGLLTRSVARSNMAAPAPSNFPATDSSSTVIANVDPTDLTLFQYTDDATPTPNFLTSDAKLTAVVVSLVTVAKSGPTSATVSFPNSVIDVRAFPGNTSQ